MTDIIQLVSGWTLSEEVCLRRVDITLLVLLITTLANIIYLALVTVDI